MWICKMKGSLTLAIIIQYKHRHQIKGPGQSKTDKKIWYEKKLLSDTGITQHIAYIHSMVWRSFVVCLYLFYSRDYDDGKVKRAAYQQVFIFLWRNVCWARAVTYTIRIRQKRTARQAKKKRSFGKKTF